MIYGNDTIEKYITCQGYYNEQGDWIEGAGEWGEPIPCDTVQPTSGSTDILTDANGIAVGYSFSVFLEPDVPPFTIGEKVRIATKGDIPHEYTVKGFRRFKTVARLWV